MNARRLQHSLLILMACALLWLGAACGSGAQSSPTPTLNGSATAGNPSGSPPSGKPQTPTSGGSPTVSMPATQTSCPPIYEGRAAVMRPLALGSHPTIAYIFNEGTADKPDFAELKRYDVTTGGKTVIVHLPQTTISEAQVSADGQWLLFVSQELAQSKLQLVRMDGQGLQMLSCTVDFVHHVQWSPDERLIMFSDVTITGRSVPYLLTLSSGVLQQELLLPDTGLGFEARTWVDTTRVYLVSLSSGSGMADSLYVLDTKKGAQQQVSDLTLVLPGSQPQYCWDFDSDYNATRLVTSSCTVTFPPGSTDRGIKQGPSSITVQSITGGSAHTAFTTPTMAITQVRLLGYTSSSLLLIMENQSFGANVSVDTSQNGLWKMNTDGSGLTRLTTEQAGNESNFNRFTQYPWSNVSFDGSLYAWQVTDMQGKDPITNLLVGSVSGGATTSFAFAHVNTEMVEVAGWTLM